MILNKIKLQKQDILFLGLSFAVLSISLAFPLGVDNSIFTRAAEVIVNGGVLYQDYVDIKPPLIYYIFAVPVKLFGDTEISIRIFDVIIQFSTIVLLWYFINSRLKSRFAANLSGLIYSLLYISLNNSMTAQSESFIGLPMVILLLAATSKINKIWSRFIVGIIIAYFTALKYNFIIVLIPILIFDFIECKGFTGKIRLWAASTVGIMVGLPIFFLPLFNHEIFHGFMNTFKYLSVYGKPTSSASSFITAYKDSAGFLGNNLSISICFLIIFSLVYILKSKNKEIQSIFYLIGLFFIFFSLTIVIENKYPPYHFLRLFALVSIFSAIGLDEIIKILRVNFSSSASGMKIITVASIFTLIVFSPIPRAALIGVKSIQTIKNPDFYHESLGRRSDLLEKYFEKKEICDIINKMNKSDKKVLVISTGMDDFNVLINTQNQWRIPQSVFYLSNIQVPDWSRIFEEDLHNAKWMVIAKHDKAPILLFYKNSIDYVFESPKYGQYILDNFNKIKENDEFVLFERKNSTKLNE